MARDQKPARVAGAVAARFGIAPAKALRLVSEPTVLGQPTHEAQARRLKRELARLGVLARVERADQAAPAAQPRRRQAPEPSRAERRAALDALVTALDRPLARPRRPLNHRLRATATAALALTAPLLYLGLVTAVAIQLVGTALQIPFGSETVGVLLGAATLLLGMLLLALLRPLLRPAPPTTRIALDARAQPQLLRLITVLCERLAVPVPETVYVDAQVNVTLNRSPGIRGLRADRLELTLGLPLLLTLDAVQLTALLAHALGHAARAAGLPPAAFVNGVNRRLHDAAYEPDPLLERCAGWARSDPTGAARLLLVAVRSGIVAVQQLLRLLLRLNLRLTGALVAQAEHDADHFAVAVAGTEPFVAAQQRLRALLAAWRAAEDVNERAYHEEHTLLEDLPAAVAQLDAAADGDHDDRYTEALQRDEGHAWHAHPAGPQRLAAARALAMPAPSAEAFPARLLLHDASTLCREATEHHYRRVIGLRRPSQWTVANDRILAHAAAQEASDQALARFFFDGLTNRILGFQPMAGDAADEADGDLYDTLYRERYRFRELGQAYHRTLDDSRHRFVSGSLLRAGAALPEGTLGALDPADPDAVDAAIAAGVEAVEHVYGELAHYDRLFQRRAAVAIATLPPDARERHAQRLAWLGAVAELREPLERLEEMAALLEAIDSVDDATLGPGVAAAQPGHRNACVAALQTLRHRLGALPDVPAAEGQAGAPSIAAYLDAAGTARTDAERMTPREAAAAVRALTGRLRSHYWSVLGDLATGCVAAEQPVRASREAA